MIDENLLIKLYQENDNLKAANIMAQKYNDFIYNTVRSNAKYKYLFDEYLSAANEVFIKSLKKYDTNINVKFATFLHKGILNAMLNVNTVHKTYLKHIGYLDDTNIKSDDDKDELPSEIRCNNNPEKLMIDKEKREELVRVINKLKIKELQVFMLATGLYDGREYNQEEIGKIISLGQTGVSRRLKKVKELFIMEGYYEQDGDNKRSKIRL